MPVRTPSPHVEPPPPRPGRRPRSLAIGLACTAAVAASMTVAVPASAAGEDWRAQVLGDGATNIRPTAIQSTLGDVTNAGALAGGQGSATLTWDGTGVAPTVIVDFGRVVNGLPEFTVTAKSAGNIGARLAYSESIGYLLRSVDARSVVATEAGATAVRLTSVANVVVGQSLVVGEGADRESSTIASAGTAAVTNPAFAPIAVGDSRIEVLSTAGYINGGELYLGDNREKVTISSIGRASFQTTLAAAAPAGATNIKVQANGQQCYEGYGCFGQAAIAVGDQLTVGGSSVTVTSVGAPGQTGAGIGVSPLPAAVDNAGTVVFHGPGLGITPAATTPQPAGAAVLYPGTGITLGQPLQKAHALGSRVGSSPGAVVGDTLQFAGTGVASARNRSVTVNALGTFSTPANQLQGGVRFAALTLTGAGSISVSNLAVVAKFPNYGPDSYVGSFQSSDARLNDIWYAGAYTLDTNIARAGDQNNSTFGVILDGAKRDRRIWIGDLYPSGLTLFSAFGYGSRGSDFQKNSLGVYGKTPGANGSINGDSGAWTAATPTTGFYSTSYSIYFPVNVAEYYRHTGDVDFIKAQYAAVKNQLAWNRTLENGSGLIETTAGNDGRDWNYYDGGKPGAVTATNVLYYRALSEAAYMARQLAAQRPGDAQAATWAADAQQWSDKAASTRTSINAHLFDPQRGVYVMSSQDNGTHSGSALAQDANALAVLWGVAEPSAQQSILAALKSNLWTDTGPQPFSRDADYSSLISPFATGYETAARFAVGDSSDAVDLIHTVWDRMVDRQNPFYTGALWENYSANGDIQDTNTSLAHGWSSGPTWQLSSYVLGVQPDKAGYTTWRVKPQTASLEWAKGRVPTPKGGIDVDWAKNAKGLTLEVTAPSGTSGEVWVPVADRQVSTVTSGTANLVRRDGGYDVYTTGAGKVAFAVTPMLITSEVATKCIGGNVYLSVSATNVSDGPIAVKLTTTYGSKSFASVQPGKTVAASINSRSATVPEGTTSAGATSSTDASLTQTVSSRYASANCG